MPRWSLSLLLLPPLLLGASVAHGARAPFEIYGQPVASEIARARTCSLPLLVGAAVDLGCVECTGDERSRALAEVDPHASRRFTAALPNPGAGP